MSGYKRHGRHILFCISTRVLDERHAERISSDIVRTSSRWTRVIRQPFHLASYNIILICSVCIKWCTWISVTLTRWTSERTIEGIRISLRILRLEWFMFRGFNVTWGWSESRTKRLKLEKRRWYYYFIRQMFKNVINKIINPNILLSDEWIIFYVLRLKNSKEALSVSSLGILSTTREHESVRYSSK